MKVAAIQHDICWEDRDATLGRLEPLVAEAAGDGARLVVLTEMFAVGFSMAIERLAEPPDGPTATWLMAQAETHGIWICGSAPVIEPGAERPANELMLAAPDGAVHRYDKIHPFTYSGEDRHFTPGTLPVTVDVDGVRTSLSVCYDLRFADQYWEQAATTDLYVVVANWPASRRHHWSSLLVARAIENQAYVVGVNRVGTGGKLDYAGDSVIIDPLGQVLAGAAHAETVLEADIDPAVVTAVRAEFPFMADRTSP